MKEDKKPKKLGVVVDKSQVVWDKLAAFEFWLHENFICDPVKPIYIPPNAEQDIK